MLPTLKLKLRCAPTLAAMIVLTMVGTMSMASDADPTGSSVDIINGLNETIVVHCSSKDNDFGQQPVYSRSNYYWKFDPNVFGKTVFNCVFLWRDKKQEFPVWQGSDYASRPNCCSRGPCVYKVSANGIYISSFATSDDHSLVEEWDFYKPWVPNPIPQ